MTSERRKTPRFLLDLPLEVSGSDNKGLCFHEAVKLINISGGGAQFITSSTEYYFEGQQLQILVTIPGTKDISGKMGSIAIVLRLNGESTTEAQMSSGQKRVSIHFLKPLRLERT
jgi:hypothetical protein